MRCALVAAASLRAIGMLIFHGSVGHFRVLGKDCNVLHQPLHPMVHMEISPLWSRVNQTSTDGFCGFAT